MQDCIFCKIIKGEIPCTKVYEDDKVFSFLDISPVNKGHTLVVPKEHHKDLLDMPDSILAEVAKAAKKIAKAVVKTTRAVGFNLHQNNGPKAGQGVMHFHFHIIPRFEDDGLKHWPQGSYEEGEDKKIAEDIKSLL
ncbi:HIT family protein [Candidatus Woesearchaeota archaeon]|nr:HIT family protein [Candidatus Woesearchaeota archaeon]